MTKYSPLEFPHGKVNRPASSRSMHGPYFKRLCSLSKELRRYANEEKKGKSYYYSATLFVAAPAAPAAAGWLEATTTTKVYRIVKLLLLQLTVPNGSPGWME